MGRTEDSPRQSIALGAHKTKSKEFYDIVRHIGARATPRSFLGLPRLCLKRQLSRASRSGRSDRSFPPNLAGESKNKSDEDAIMRREVMMLRTVLTGPKLEKNKLKEYLIRLMYVEMLGHDAAFGYIHAVKATNESDVSLKRVGYLATSAFLDENDELIILIVNTVQQDLKSDNYLVVCAALTTICRLVNEETIPAVLPQVTELLNHPQMHVRKKAVMALHKFHLKSPSSVSHLHGKFRQMLCDKDPSVMSAALCALHDLTVSDPTPQKNLVPSFVSILKQVVEHRLPKSYDYHRVPAPFIQIRLLKILAQLGAADQKAATEMYSVLSAVLKKGDNQSSIGNAIVYECVRTAASIYPSPVLLEHCAGVVSRFVKSSNNNLKYAGLDALSCIVNINPKYATEHQMAVVDCLTDPDESLRKKTLDLLYRMTKSNNVEVIVEKMMDFLRDATDHHLREETASRISELAERYAPSTQWFIDTMNALFEVGGDVVKKSTAHNLMALIAEGSGEDADDATLRRSAVTAYLELISKPMIPRVLFEVILWVVGEYGTLSGRSPTALMDTLCAAVEAQPEGDAVQAQAMTACAKLAAANGGQLSEKAAKLVDRNLNSRSIDRQQRAYEITALLRENPALVVAALPRDGSCEDLEVNPALPALEAYVSKALAEGASAYLQPSERSSGLREAGAGGAPHGLGGSEDAGSLRFDAYDAPAAAGGAYDPHRPSPRAPDQGIAAAAATQSGEMRLSSTGGSWGEPAGRSAPPPEDNRAALANALFSGVGAAAPAASAPAASAPRSDMDLLMGLDAPPPTAAAPPPTDLLAGLSVGGGAAPAPAPANFGLDALYGGATAQTGAGGFDLLGSGGTGMVGGHAMFKGPDPSDSPKPGQSGGAMNGGTPKSANKKKDPFADLLG